MHRHLKLGIAAALTAAPVPVLAQTWPAGAAIAIGHETVATPRLHVPTIDEPVWRGPPRAAGWSSTPQAALRLQISSAQAPDALPQVKVPAKPEWTDDQGFRLHYAEITYKQRF